MNAVKNTWAIDHMGNSELHFFKIVIGLLNIKNPKYCLRDVLNIRIFMSAFLIRRFSDN